ncbi:MAG TPA: M67 family metallopeptidase [Solirubrobacteraceae bacterium]|nr:M67 family metallopeptidase [Solirubrobacteraceae bacterium]
MSSAAGEAMRVPRELYERMLEHARAEAPNECCGFLATRAGAAVSVHPTRNAAASPMRFEIDSRELFSTYFAIEDAGCEAGVIYHSHTRSEPYPSQTDINFAAKWPGVWWLILGLAGSEPEARIYEIRDGVVAERSLQVE